MILDGQLCEKDGKISLTDDARASMSEMVEIDAKPLDIVPPRSAPEFRPISAKYVPNAGGRRPGTEAREFSFKALSSKIPVRGLYE